MTVLAEICINCTNGGGTVILLVSLKGGVYLYVWRLLNAYSPAILQTIKERLKNQLNI